MSFSTGEEFLRRLKTETFDLVLLASNLSDISAKDLLWRIQQSPLCDVPVIIMGNTEESAGVAEMLGAGADDYVVRPVRLEAFAFPQ